jgi:hypothetical protein
MILSSIPVRDNNDDGIFMAITMSDTPKPKQHSHFIVIFHLSDAVEI